MELTSRTLLVSNVKLPVNASEQEAFSVALEKLRKSGYAFREHTCRIYRRSVDARRRNELHFVYSVAVTALLTRIPRSSTTDVTELCESTPEVVRGDEPLSARPMIVGMGPCGLFAALLLAQEGYKPILIDRGGSVAERTKDRLIFNTQKLLNPESNVQFGAGGAGTFSDGKLVTRINDPLSAFVLDTLISFGAPESIR